MAMRPREQSREGGGSAELLFWLTVVVVAITAATVGCGGTDVDGRRDAATDAAEALDASPDALPASGDAGAADASLPDASVVDGATPDSPLTDAAIDAALPDAGLPDAATPDATPLGCTPSGEYVEVAEATNDVASGGSAEPTGLNIPDGPLPFTIGGCIASDVATVATADADYFGFEYDGATGLMGTPMRFTLNWSAPIGPQHALRLYDADGTLVASAFGCCGTAVLRANVRLGLHWVAVERANPAPAEAYSYEVTIELGGWGDACLFGGPLDYVEADESATGHRANDMFGVSWGAPFPDVVPSSAADAPEPTGITALPGTDYVLQGVSADVPSDGDDYRDRDAFLFTAGPGTTEVDVDVGVGTGSANLDVFVSVAGDPTMIVGGTVTTRPNFELATVVLTPGLSYWVWVAARDGVGATALPATYQLHLCPL